MLHLVVLRPPASKTCFLSPSILSLTICLTMSLRILNQFDLWRTGTGNRHHLFCYQTSVLKKKNQPTGKVQGTTFYLLLQLTFNIPPTQIIFCAPVVGLKQCQVRALYRTLPLHACDLDSWVQLNVVVRKWAVNVVQVLIVPEIKSVFSEPQPSSTEYLINLFVRFLWMGGRNLPDRSAPGPAGAGCSGR